MTASKNIVCLDLEFGNELESEHMYNMEIIGKNLDDFNTRLNTDVMLSYDPEYYSFSPIDENDENAIWFCEGIGELLAFAHSPTNNTSFDVMQYLNERRKELNYIVTDVLFEPYRRRYWEYAPIGFLNEENMAFIQNELSRMLSEKADNF